MDKDIRQLQAKGIPEYGIRHFFPTDGNDVYIRQMHLMAGNCVATHKHVFEHFAILGAGTAVVEVDGIESTHISPSVIAIKAGQVHKISAITDITWFCVHGTKEKDSEKIDEVLIK